MQQQRGRDQPNAETIRGRHDVPAAAAAMAERKAKRVKRTGTRSIRGRGHRRRETRGTVCGRQWKRSDVVQPLSRMTTIHARNPRRDAKKRRFVNAFGPGIGTVPVTDDSPRRRTTAVVRPPRRVENFRKLPAAAQTKQCATCSCPLSRRHRTCTALIAAAALYCIIVGGPMG